MSGTLVEEALRSTYQLAGGDADRLRRLTRAAGLDAENVLSRLAIARSASEPDADAGTVASPSRSARVKEIKGGVLLGRARSAALLLVLVARHPAPLGERDLRAKVNWHWARGLRLLERDARAAAGPSGLDPLRAVALTLAELPSTGEPPARAAGGGLGRGGRDRAAAAVGRLYPRWPTEVRRLVAMAARLDPDQVGVVARRVADEAAERGFPQVSETAVLAVMASWGLNRLGLSDADRSLLAALLDDDGTAARAAGADGGDGAAFLASLGLVQNKNGRLRPTERGRRMGPEAIKA